MMLYRVKMEGLSDLSVKVEAVSVDAAEAKIHALNLMPWAAIADADPVEPDDQEVAPGVWIKRGGGLLEPLLKLFGVPAYVR